MEVIPGCPRICSADSPVLYRLFRRLRIMKKTAISAMSTATPIPTPTPMPIFAPLVMPPDGCADTGRPPSPFSLFAASAEDVADVSAVPADKFASGSICDAVVAPF